MDDFLGVIDSTFLGGAAVFLGGASVFLGGVSVFFGNTGDGFLGTSGGGPVRVALGELSGDFVGFGGGTGGLDSNEHKVVATQRDDALLNI